MALLPHRQSAEPMNSEQPPKKKRIFYDRINEEDLYQSDESSWDEASSNHSSTAAATVKTNSHAATIRSLFANQHSGTTSKATKRASRGIRDLFQSSSCTLKEEPQYATAKKKRESISTLFSSNHSRKQSTTKEAEQQQSQGSLYSSSSTATSLSTCSTESMNQHFEVMPMEDQVTNNAKSHLIPPFAKKINIHWSVEEEDVFKNWRNQRALYRVESIHPHHEEHGEEDEEADSEDSYSQALVASTLKREKSRKRRSSGSLVPAPVKALLSAPMTRENSPLPPLPTVENFLTIMNAPTSPDSSYFSARSVSSNSSSQSTLNSILLDDVTDGLESTHIMESCLSSDSHSSSDASSMASATKKADVPVTIKSSPSSTASSIPPPVPPKDHDLKRMLTMDPQGNATTNINNKQEKRSSITMSPETLKRVYSSKKKKIAPSTAEMRITTSDIPNNHHASFAPKSADTTSTFRPPIPPRRSSMPLPPPKSNSNAAMPPLPVDAKKKADAYSRRPSKLDDASSWTSFLGIKKEESAVNNTDKKAKLGRSLGATATKKAKKSDSSNLLKVTENGQVVLLYEMKHGKLQVIAGTTERLLEKLADETTQDMEYVDTFLMNYGSFTTSMHLLNQLISRFHLGPLPGEHEYFKKWQHSIQSKVLTVIDRWVTLQYQDFKYDLDLQKKLNLFLFNNDTVLLQQFRQQVDKIQYNLKLQIQQFSNHQHHVSVITANQHISAPPSNAFHFHFSFGNSSQSLPTTVHTSNTSNTRRPSNGLFSSSSSIPPELPMQIHDSSSLKTTLHTSLVSLESKDIARYLTLADFYLFKSIQSRELMSNNNNHKTDINYTELMTKRANMLSHWVVHEICSISYLKPKRSLLKKFIEIAKLCLEFNNFHTCMVITMGLASAPKLKDVWETLSNRDTNTFASLQKLLDVSMNMRYYRQKIQLAKAPSIPFLPVVLKDQTFFRENSTFLISRPHLVNFAKFTSIRQFVDKTKALTRENYYFSNDLTRYPFFSMTPSETDTTTTTTTTSPPGGPLDCIADWVEDRLSQVQSCYLHCDLLSKL
ncbi:uncharacterized protein ATC70_013483 [Mucor velutinosus]|uniref:Uncharacterized protein n=1 Tax=Mucor velutinosus TaxID=708070 RepID=A0AAN7D6M5_9FUNG|nr:hypothetical protein ATC70_013483 [Mucor velutinosus]